jgi:hypothetical protein
MMLLSFDSNLFSTLHGFYVGVGEDASATSFNRLREAPPLSSSKSTEFDSYSHSWCILIQILPCRTTRESP